MLCYLGLGGCWHVFGGEFDGLVHPKHLLPQSHLVVVIVIGGEGGETRGRGEGGGEKEGSERVLKVYHRGYYVLL